MTSHTPRPAADRPDFRELAALLAGRFGPQFTMRAADLDAHAATEGWLPPQNPQAVIFATSTQDVQDILKVCDRYGVPVVPYGGGTSIEGQVNAPLGGISLDLSRMNAIVRLTAENLTVTVQPGVRREDLNKALKPHGLFFPVDPGANATLGGMAGTRASGTRAVGYGTMRDNVACARVVLASGQEMRLGTEATKSATGYDLLRLFVGSEGTLGVFVELTLRVQPIPECISVGSAAFGSVAAAVDAVIAVRRHRLGITRIELLDGISIRAANAYSGLKLPEKVHLFFEISGSETVVAHEMALVTELLGVHGGDGLRVARDDGGPVRVWQARHEIWWATHALFPGKSGLPTDACVPIARLAECVEFAIAEAERAGLVAPLCGHVGDGNFHMLVMVDPDDPAAAAKASALSRAVAGRAVELGGTCSGEHGIGQGKRALMRLEHGHGVDIMARIKQALDPRGILNPGKIIEDVTE